MKRSISGSYHRSCLQVAVKILRPKIFNSKVGDIDLIVDNSKDQPKHCEQRGIKIKSPPFVKDPMILITIDHLPFSTLLICLAQFATYVTPFC